MKHTLKSRRMLASLLLIIALLIPSASAFAGGGKEHVIYRVTIENLTTGQIFSPPIFITHSNGFKFFKIGGYASEAVREIAENGNTSPAFAAASTSKHVFDVVAPGTPVMPGASLTVEIHALRGARLSLAAMLVQTNDGFTGLAGFKLPKHGGAMKYLNTYDAGTEANNELAAYIPGPPFGGGMRAPTVETIQHHPGILGVGDLDPATYDWDDPSARITVEVVE